MNIGENQINVTKGSSHPLVPGGVYIGVIRWHDSNPTSLPTVFVPQLGCTYTKVNYLNNSTRTIYQPNDRVLCTFIDLETQEIFVLGGFNKKLDVFAGKTKFNLLIDEMQTQINTLRASLATPLSNISLTSFKQTD